MKKAKTLVWMLVLALCIGLFPAAAFAEDAAANAAVQEAAEEEQSLPSWYDLRHVPTEDGGEVSYVTPVKLQNPYGTCWGYAAIAAAESSLLSSGLAAKYGFDANTLDLSEKHVAFFATSHINDPDSPQNGEGSYFRNLTEDEEKSYSYRYNAGGWTCMATTLFASGIGPVFERDIDPTTGKAVDTIFTYKGKNGAMTFWETITSYDNNNQPVDGSARLNPIWYDRSDDWYIPDEYRFYQAFRLKDSLILPGPVGYDYSTGSYYLNQSGVDAIKEQISKYHRAVCIAFCAESYLPGQDTTGKMYMSENWAHYTNTPEYANHEVTIVGYDDNYPKENFSSTTENGGSAQPEGDGAFLIKNSWGSELNEFPNNGLRHWGLLDGQDGVPYDPNAKAKEGNKATGYFWISYYDQSLYDPEAFIFEDFPSEYGYYVEQLDYMIASRIIGLAEYDPDIETKMANVFTAEATSKLDQISVMTLEMDTTVDYEIYLLGEGFSGPTDGILIDTGKAEFEYGGYHRIKLNSPRVLTKGQKYSVVIKEVANGISYIGFTADLNYPDADLYFVSVINKDESFYYNGKRWLDESEPETQDKLIGYWSDYDLTIDNFPIKSYLEPVTYKDGDNNKVFNGYLSVFNWSEGNSDTYELKVGESKTLIAEFKGMTESMPSSWNPSFEWRSENTRVFTVTPVSPKNGRVEIKGLQPGITKLVVNAGDYGTKVLTIKVSY